MILLRERREAKGWSQAELAKRSGVSQQNISLMEKGERPNPGMNTVDALARCLECSVYDIWQPDQNSESEG